MGKLIAAGLVFLVMLAGPVGAADKQLDPAKVASQKVKIDQAGDKFKGQQMWAPRPKELPGAGFLTTLYVNPVYFKQDDGLSGYYFWISYSGFGWMFPKGQVIFLLDDGSKIELNNADIRVDSEVESCGTGGCLTTEIFRIAILENDMQRIAKAKSVEVAVYGRSQYLSAYFKPYHQAAVIEALRIGASMGGAKSANP